MWNKLRYKYAKLIYVLFYKEWNKRFANSRELRREFSTSFKLWEERTPEETSQLAMDYAISWNRTSQEKTVENLAKLFDTAMLEIKRAS